MTESQYKQKVIRHEWCINMSDEYESNQWDDEIYQLSDEINKYESIDLNKKPTSRIKLLEYNMKKYGIKQIEMSNILGITQGHLNNILAGRKQMSAKLGYKIDNFDFHSLDAKK